MIVDSCSIVSADHRINRFYDDMRSIIQGSWSFHNREVSTIIKILKKDSLINDHVEESLVRCVSSVHHEYSSVHCFQGLYSFFKSLDVVNDVSCMSSVPVYDFIMLSYCYKFPRRFFFLDDYKIEDFLLKGLSRWGNIRSVTIMLSILVSLSPHRIITYDDWTMIVDSIDSVDYAGDLVHIELIVEAVCTQVLAKNSYAYYHRIDLGMVKLLLIADKLVID